MSQHFYRHEILFWRKSSTVTFFLKGHCYLKNRWNLFDSNIRICTNSRAYSTMNNYWCLLLKRKPWLFLYLEKELSLCALLRHCTGKHGAVTHCGLALLSIKTGNQWEELASTKLWTKLYIFSTLINYLTSQNRQILSKKESVTKKKINSLLGCFVGWLAAGLFKNCSHFFPESFFSFLKNWHRFSHKW